MVIIPLTTNFKLKKEVAMHEGWDWKEGYGFGKYAIGLGKFPNFLV